MFTFFIKSIQKNRHICAAGSINLVNVRSVDLDGGLGLVLRTISRDYRLLFDSPSDKDMWHDRILVLFHRARRRIDEKSSDAMATKFATWASLVATLIIGCCDIVYFPN